MFDYLQFNFVFPFQHCVVSAINKHHDQRCIQSQITLSENVHPVLSTWLLSIYKSNYSFDMHYTCIISWHFINAVSFWNWE